MLKNSESLEIASKSFQFQRFFARLSFRIELSSPTSHTLCGRIEFFQQNRPESGRCPSRIAFYLERASFMIFEGRCFQPLIVIARISGGRSANADALSLQGTWAWHDARFADDVQLFGNGP